MAGIYAYLDPKLSDIGVRITKVEGAIRILAAEHARLLQDLIRDLLAQAAEENRKGDLARATKAIQFVPVLLTSARERQIPASAEYFQELIETLNTIQPATSTLSREIHQTRVGLAEYRSAIGPVPPTPDRTVTCIKLDPPYLLRRNISVTDSKLSGCTQVLDGIHWTNVVFVNAHVKYLGEEVSLRNVRFVNCTFEFTRNANGRRLAEHVALQQTSFTVGSQKAMPS